MAWTTSLSIGANVFSCCKWETLGLGLVIGREIESRYHSRFNSGTSAYWVFGQRAQGFLNPVPNQQPSLSNDFSHRLCQSRSNRSR